ncbi:Aldolase-type TIM barrel family protein [Striga hermonthica]|uniref:indole-3-glycerol-phosphate synthase n=1 Tax=Striga hermonthica TaxID=68872 RepID=A0A9N7MW47_STRHE|nr:Aldolase-type TIM barrel family protein [Striga hermonthica]
MAAAKATQGFSFQRPLNPTPTPPKSALFKLTPQTRMPNNSHHNQFSMPVVKCQQGSFENLEAIRKSGVQCPLLCKEFVVDAWQIFYARVKGADAILLIAAVLPDLDIKYMIKICKLLGLTALVEVHDELEMDRVLDIDGIELVGINNRDLGTFVVDITNTKKLLEGERGQRIIEKGITVVGESGLFTPADIAYVHEAGVKAVLVGESIVKQKDPCAGITQLFGKDISS